MWSEGWRETGDRDAFMVYEGLVDFHSHSASLSVAEGKASPEIFTPLCAVCYHRPQTSHCVILLYDPPGMNKRRNMLLKMWEKHNWHKSLAAGVHKYTSSCMTHTTLKLKSSLCTFTCIICRFYTEHEKPAYSYPLVDLRGGGAC